MGRVIEVRDLTRRFGAFTAVDSISMDIVEGDIFGFLGPNGAGKTTVIRMLCGLLRPTSGSGTVLGNDIVSDTEAIKRGIGYMSQQFSLYTDLTVLENLTFYAGVYGIPRRERKHRIDEVIDIVGIGDYRTRLAANLSGGWKQRLALACALVHQPRLMFLDEPTAGIDPVARRDLWDLLFDLAGRGVTFFVTTHYMDEAERCSHLGYIYAAKLMAYGTPNELKALPEVTPEGVARYEIRVPGVIRAMRQLDELPYVRDATIFGDALHVLADEGTADSLQRDLGRSGFEGAEVREVPATLEDVFVTLTRLRVREQQDV